MKGPAIIPRAGFVLGGSGRLKFDQTCAGPDFAPDVCDQLPPSSSPDYTDQSTLVVELALLLHALPELRVGLGGYLLPGVEVKNDETGAKFDMGHELDIVAIVEGVIPTQSIVYVPIRAFVGPQVLFPESDLKRERESSDDLCARHPAMAGTTCAAETGPVLGLTAGGGLGIIIAAHRMLRLRADVTFQYVRSTVLEFEARGGGNEAELSVLMEGTRWWLTGGLEFGPTQ